MPTYIIDESQVFITPGSVIVDTSVFVKAFNAKEDGHDYARFFLEDGGYRLLIPVATVIETWGLLWRRTKDYRAGNEFLAWLNTPGKSIALVAQKGHINEEIEIIKAMHIDCVDAIIANLANDMAIKCSLQQGLFVASYDKRDFYNLKGKGSMRLKILNMDSLEFEYYD